MKRRKFKYLHLERQIGKGMVFYFCQAYNALPNPLTKEVFRESNEHHLFAPKPLLSIQIHSYFIPYWPSRDAWPFSSVEDTA